MHILLTHSTLAIMQEVSEEEVGGVGGGRDCCCGASRCSLIVPGDCAASNCNPAIHYTDGAVSFIKAMR